MSDKISSSRTQTRKRSTPSLSKLRTQGDTFWSYHGWFYQGLPANFPRARPRTLRQDIPRQRRVVNPRATVTTHEEAIRQQQQARKQQRASSVLLPCQSSTCGLLCVRCNPAPTQQPLTSSFSIVSSSDAQKSLKSSRPLRQCGAMSKVVPAS